MITRARSLGKNYRKLGRGQYPLIAPLACTAGHSGNDAILTFNRPIVVNGPVSLTVGTRTFVSQVLTSPTVLTVTMSGATTSLAYAMPANDPHIRGSHGEGNAALAGTFS
jgi:hypothetical protein